ncbi:MAG: PEP-CTERM sorting domain-containing protein, partial [Planctomycetota bacterium]
EPPAGMYAFQIGLALVDGSETYRSEPLWVVFNNGLDEHAHEEAMAYLVPEPASIFLLAGAGGWLVARRRR